ncbi:MAG: hypothetical protein RL375_1567, partial [Pseudomonadota bacterium]
MVNPGSSNNSSSNNSSSSSSIPRNTVCLWYDGSALAAAEFYARTFADSTVRA